MTRERIWLTLINIHLTTANTNVEVVAEDNVVHVDFAAMAASVSASIALAA